MTEKQLLFTGITLGTAYLGGRFVWKPIFEKASTKITEKFELGVPKKTEIYSEANWKKILEEEALREKTVIGDYWSLGKVGGKNVYSFVEGTVNVIDTEIPGIRTAIMEGKAYSYKLTNYGVSPLEAVEVGGWGKLIGWEVSETSGTLFIKNIGTNIALQNFQITPGLEKPFPSMLVPTDIKQATFYFRYASPQWWKELIPSGYEYTSASMISYAKNKIYDSSFLLQKVKEGVRPSGLQIDETIEYLPRNVGVGEFAELITQEEGKVTFITHIGGEGFETPFAQYNIGGTVTTLKGKTTDVIARLDVYDLTKTFQKPPVELSPGDVKNVIVGGSASEKTIQLTHEQEVMLKGIVSQSAGASIRASQVSLVKTTSTLGANILTSASLVGTQPSGRTLTLYAPPKVTYLEKIGTLAGTTTINKIIERTGATERVVSLEKIGTLERTDIFERIGTAERTDILERTATLERSNILERASISQKTSLLEKTAILEREGTLERELTIGKTIQVPPPTITVFLTPIIPHGYSKEEVGEIKFKKSKLFAGRGEGISLPLASMGEREISFVKYGKATHPPITSKVMRLWRREAGVAWSRGFPTKELMRSRKKKSRWI